MIERGRHLKIPRDLRYCPYCVKQGLSIVEDEMHFLLVCPLYKLLRQTYFPSRWYNGVIDIQLFIHIMSDTNMNSIMSVARYLVDAYELKRQCVDSITNTIVC